MKVVHQNLEHISVAKYLILPTISGWPGITGLRYGYLCIHLGFIIIFTYTLISAIIIWQ